MRFEVDAPAEIEVSECNCSICSRSGYLHLIVPRERFRLLRGEFGQDEQEGQDSADGRDALRRDAATDPRDAGATQTPEGSGPEAEADEEPWAVRRCVGAAGGQSCGRRERGDLTWSVQHHS